MHGSPLICSFQLLIGFLCSVFGGYVAAWIAKHDELLNGALSSFLCVLLGIATVTLAKDFSPIATKTLLIVASPVCGLFGGYLRRSQSRPIEQSI